jgi:DnaJ-class molecular chaperone
MVKKDYYSILGVGRDASGKEIKQAYRRLARRYHPDVNPGDATAEQKFKEISEAYSVLGNAENRKHYDRFGHQAFMAGFDPSSGRGHAFRGFQTGNFKDFFGGNFADGFSGIFEEFFGRGPARSPNVRRRGQDIEQTVEIDFEAAIHGTITEVQVRRQDGSSEWLRVKIPPGVDNNSKVRLGGKGEASSSGEAAGDLYIVTRIRPHAYFVRQGNDIMCEVPVTLAEAMLGARIEIPTVHGKTAMTLPAGTQNGRKFRLRGKGVPHLKSGSQGDHYVTVKVVLPDNLDTRSRALIEEFDQRNPLQPRAQTRW